MTSIPLRHMEATKLVGHKSAASTQMLPGAGLEPRKTLSDGGLNIFDVAISFESQCGIATVVDGLAGCTRPTFSCAAAKLIWPSCGKA